MNRFLFFDPHRRTHTKIFTLAYTITCMPYFLFFHFLLLFAIASAKTYQSYSSSLPRLLKRPLAHDHPLQPSHVAFFGCDFEIAVDNTIQWSARSSCLSKCVSNTYVTANKIPVPDPSAPIKSLATLNPPMQAPPKAAAVGMIRLSSLYMLCSRWPAITRPCSFNCLATSRGADPLTSIQVFEKIAQATSMNTT